MADDWKKFPRDPYGEKHLKRGWMYFLAWLANALFSVALLFLWAALGAIFGELFALFTIPVLVILMGLSGKLVEYVPAKCPTCGCRTKSVYEKRVAWWHVCFHCRVKMRQTPPESDMSIGDGGGGDGGGD